MGKKKEGIKEKDFGKDKELFKKIVEHSNNLFYIHDSNNIIKYVSPQSEDFFGLKPEECKIKWTKLVTKNPINKEGFKITEKAIKTGIKQKPYLLEVKRKNGSPFNVEVEETPIKNKKGKVTMVIGALRDITEQKRAKEKLSLSENKWKMLFDNAPYANYIIDLRGKFIDGNLASEKLTGYKRKELIGNSFVSLGILDKKSIPRAIKNLALIFAGKKSKPNEYTLVRKNGEKRIIETTTHLITIDGKKVALGIAHDITYRKNTEKLIEKEKEKAEKYLDLAGTMIVSLNTKGEITLINKKGSEILGYKESELIGKNWFDNFIPEKINQEVKKVFKKIISGEIKSLETYENEIINKNKEKRIILWHNTILWDDSRKITGLLSSGEDITERKKAEKALKKSEERFKDIAYNMSDWVWEVDAKGKYTYCSPKVEKILGYSPKEMIGKTPFHFMPKEEKIRVKKLFINFVEKKGEIKDLENVNLRKDGEKILVSTSGIPVIEKGVFKGYRGIDKDITNKKNIQKEILKKAQELEKFNQFAVGRELKMIELKKEINKLLKEKGVPEKYKINYEK